MELWKFSISESYRADPAPKRPEWRASASRNINECIGLYLKTEDEKVQKKAKWSKLYESFKKFLWKMVHRETAMERYEREKYRVAKKSRFENLKLNVTDWS